MAVWDNSSDFLARIAEAIVPRPNPDRAEKDKMVAAKVDAVRHAAYIQESKFYRKSRRR